MAFSVLWKSFLFGPMFSALTFQVITFFYSGFFQHSITEFINVFFWLCVGAYLLAFIPITGGLPGMVPLAIYGGLLAFLIDPLINKMNTHGIKPLVKVLCIICLSVFVGLLVYYPFFLLSSHADYIVKLLLTMVIPTSIIFGVWFGLSSFRKHS